METMNNNYKNFNPYIIASSILRLQDCPPPGTLFEQRVVRWYELDLINESEGGYVITDGKKLYAKKGDIFVRKPGMIVQGVSAYACDIIIFDTVYDKSLNNEYNDPKYDSASQQFLNYYNSRGTFFDIVHNLPNKISITDYKYFKSLFNECFEHFITQEKDFQYHGKRILYSLLHSINQEVKKQNELRGANSEKDNNHHSILLVKKYIDEHFNESVTLKSLSKLAGYNPEFFCRLFKKSIGQSPINYLLNVRHIHSKRLLITTNYSIKKISLLCGFKNDTYFYTFFKSKENMSPTKFRLINRYIGV